jgi:polyhydroxyalkanoate synthase subunit PhaE
MSQTDYMKYLSDIWTKSGNAFSAAQEQMFKDVADRMGKGFLFPLQAFASNDANLEQAGAEFRNLILSTLKLPPTVAQGEGEAGVRDAVTVELLQKIFDPREWLSATGYMDDTVRRITEGPKLADLWQVEGKFLALMKAWSETRTHSIEQSTHVLAAWTKAAEEFAGKLRSTAQEGQTLASRSEVVALWVEIANRHLLEAQRSTAFLETQRKLLQASTDLRLAQQDLGDFYGEFFGLPTRVEIDDLTRTVAKLRHDFRADRRQRKQQRKKWARKPKDPA